MVEFGLFLGADPDDRLAVAIDFYGQLPSFVGGHVRDVLEQALGDMLEGVEVVVENDDFEVGVGLPGGLSRLFGSRNGATNCAQGNGGRWEDRG